MFARGISRCQLTTTRPPCGCHYVMLCRNLLLSRGICTGTDTTRSLHVPNLFPIVSKQKFRLKAALSARNGRHMATIGRSSHDRVRAFVALGSNIGDRLGTIQEACRRIDASVDMQVIRTSGLWETKAMYVLDQSDFLNGVCEVSADLPERTQQYD